jgi:hypothetical protein
MKHIAIIVERDSGVFYHRLVAPYSYLANKGKIKLAILNGLDSANVGFIAKEKIDAVVFNRVLHPQPKQVETIAKLKKLGVMVVADVDDYWILPQDHFAYRSWIDEGLQHRIPEALKLADVVTTTHERLAAKCREIGCKNVVIAANAIDYTDEQFAPVRNYPNKPLVFGWQGSAAHPQTRSQPGGARPPCSHSP